MHRFTKRLGSDFRTRECFLFPHPHHYIIKAYIKEFLLPSTLCLTVKKTLQGIPKDKKKNPQFEEIEQALEPDIAEMLEFSDREIKTTLIC